MHDLVIRGGTVVDGTGAAPFVADIGIAGRTIAYVGPDAGPAVEEIDATGLIVTPGFVDPHTHFDAQATWDPILAPTAWHGVTTVVTGNCGVGFAPARPDARDWLIGIMEDVEEIPVPVLKAGLAWDWESFPDYLDALDARQHSIDIAALVPHIALRSYVMQERAVRDEPATPADVAEMGRLLEEALRAGGIGLGCSRTDFHRFADGRLIPGSMGDLDELLALGDSLRRVGHGHVQYLGTFADWDIDFPFMTEMSRRSGAAFHFVVIDNDRARRFAGIDQAAEQGARLIAHVPPRAVGNYLHWQATRHPFIDRPSIRAIAHLPWEERYARLADPAFRARALSEANEGTNRLAVTSQSVYHAFDRMYVVGDRPDFEPDPTTDSIAALAAKSDQEPAALAYDTMMRNGGTGLIYMALANYQAGDLSEVRELICHPHSVPSLSDAGAHCLRVVDASATTFMLTHWARDRTRGETLPIELVVKGCTRDPAAAFGFDDRGVIAPGYLADLNVIDLQRLTLPVPYVAHDLPAGGMRLLQKAEGYAATIKSGQVTFRNGVHCGAYPGKVVRGPQSPVAV